MRIDLAEMISLLEVNHLPYKNAVRHIFALSNANNLPLYFSSYKQLFSVKCNDVFIENYDNSDVEGYRFGEWSGYVDRIENVSFNPNLPPLSINEDYPLNWKIWNYFIGDDQYLYTDENGFDLEPIVINDLDIYCNKDDLQASGLLNNSTNSDNANSQPASPESSTASKKKPRKTERQISAFKKWLIQESLLPFSSDEGFYQSCYRKIGKPTREEAWAALVKFAPEDFDKKIEASIKKQDFFNRGKGGQSIVQFEGNSR